MVLLLLYVFYSYGTYSLYVGYYVSGERYLFYKQFIYSIIISCSNMMEQARFKETLAKIYTDFAKARLLDNYLSVDLFDKLSESCTVDMYCYKCRYLSQINFFCFDDHVNAHCESCQWDYNHLDVELRPLLYLNVLRAKDQRILEAKQDCC